MTEPKPKTVSIWLRPELDAAMALRGDNRSQTMAQDLGRLYALYDRALREIDLTENEAMLIVDALNGVLIGADAGALLWANIADSIRLDGLDEKWSVDGPALVEKLQAMTATQAMAVLDAAERFWQQPEKDAGPWVRECFRIK